MFVFKQSSEQLQQASNWLQQGQLLAYPTESVWGIGCDAMCEQAVKQILTIKNRPIDKGMIVITDSVSRIEPLLTTLSSHQRNKIIKSWCQKNSPYNSTVESNPTFSHSVHKQAITWLLPLIKSHSDRHIPRWITGQHNSVAVRVIAHPLIQKLCQSIVSENNPFGFIISTSCNPAGYEPARTQQEAINYFSNFANVGYLQGSTLGYALPSQIKDGLTGQSIR